MITLISEPEYPTHRRSLCVSFGEQRLGLDLGKEKSDTNQGTSQVCHLITVVHEQVVFVRRLLLWRWLEFFSVPELKP